LQAVGKPAELLMQYGQTDLEELFFFLVDQANRASGESAAI